MIKTIGILLASIAALSACSGSTEGVASEPTPEKTYTQPAYTPPPVVNEEEVYIQFVRARGSYDIEVSSDETLISLGKSLCNALESGASAETVIQMGLDSNVSGDDVALILGASIGAFCPDQKYKLE
jgi:ABC-type glycerol-3-phosphate transport system substrate-binding protein